MSTFIRMELCLIVLVGVASSSCTDRAQQIDHDSAMSREAAGLAASIAASFEVAAARACRIAGIDDIAACAQQTGELLPEKEARAVAKVALAQRTSFSERCRKAFDVAYCDGLLSRAIEMEWRKPAESPAPMEAEPG